MTASAPGKTWEFPFCPKPPAWQLDWRGVVEAFPLIRQMAGCGQEPLYHAEGDVLTHTRLICERLAELPAWRALGPVERSIVFAGCLLHDVAKPVCSREEGGHITTLGHSRKGARIARQIFWELWPEECSLDLFHAREAIVSLVQRHGLPLYFLDRPDPARALIEASMTTRLDWLATLAEADVLGRISGEQSSLLDRVGLFREFAEEKCCFSCPFPFASDHSRFSYFRKDDLPPDALIYDDTRCEVVLLSGLPGSGKDAWIEKQRLGLAVISLDGIRTELGISPRERQGRVASEARARARAHLRRAEQFIWNATNTTRMMRQRLVGLFASYGARSRVVYVETSPNELARRNRARSSGVPGAVLEKLRDSLDIPDLTEAHSLEIIAN